MLVGAMIPHLPRISIATLPHKSQNYDTAGDYMEVHGSNAWVMRVSELPDWRYEALITVHELVEMLLTKHRGIGWEKITAFDLASGHPDPGSLEDAPYHKEHMFAEKIEKMLAKELGVKWKDYNEALDALEHV